MECSRTRKSGRLHRTINTLNSPGRVRFTSVTETHRVLGILLDHSILLEPPTCPCCPSNPGGDSGPAPGWAWREPPPAPPPRVLPPCRAQQPPSSAQMGSPALQGPPGGFPSWVQLPVGMALNDASQSSQRTRVAGPLGPFKGRAGAPSRVLRQSHLPSALGCCSPGTPLTLKNLA